MKDILISALRNLPTSAFYHQTEIFTNFTDLSLSLFLFLSLWLSKEKFKYETHEVNLLIIKGIMIYSSIIRIISMVLIFY